MSTEVHGRKRDRLHSHGMKRGIVAIAMVAVACLISVPQAGAITGTRYDADDAGELFVQQANVDFLGSWAPGSSLTGTVSTSYYNSQGNYRQVDISTAASRSEYLTYLANSDIWLGATIDRFYVDTLGRPADAAGKEYWISVLQSGAGTVASVGAQFYASNEYYSHIGGNTLPSWVNNLYTKLLGRSADVAGRNYWVSVAQSQGRGAVAYAFFQSAESRQHRVKALYTKLLGRQADQAGLQYWTQQVLTQGDINLAVSLASSGEYLARAQRPYLVDLPTAQGTYYYDSYGINGVQFRRGLKLQVNQFNSPPEFDMARAYKHLVGTVGTIDTGRANISMNVKIYVDGVIRFNQNTSLGQSTRINLDVTNALRLKLLVTCVAASCSGGNNWVGFGDLQLLPY